MSPRLCLLGCHNFHAEVAAAIAAEGWDDVVAVEFPARCGRPPVDWDELRPRLPADCTQVMVLGRICLSRLGTPPAGWPPARIVPVGQCFHLVAGETLVDEAIAGGAYLVTPAWLANWRGQLQAMGFDPDQAGEFFHDFAREVLLLDTGTDPQAAGLLAELQAAVGLPARRVAVGLDAMRQRLARLVLEWRLDAAQEAALRQANERADHVAAMDMLVQLARTQHENEAIDAIEELFRMLFAPAALHYLRVENGAQIPRAAIPDDLLEALRGLEADHAWTPDGAGFLVRIGHGEATLGLVAVDQLAFPLQRERYLNLALAVTGVCGLAIENARNRKHLLEAEKMASLGILVAGVAHEINTPLGVGLMAVSTLQDRSRSVAEHFAEQSMTRSELAQYLETAAATTALIQQNLARISHLVDAFRQVAVGGHRADGRPLRLRDCLDDVLRSLGNRLPADRVSVHVECAPDLEIEGVASDWASIFINLIGNSLQHGFRDRERGRIDIRIVGEARRLRLEYRDDGVGLPPEAQARIFDPFFTTDMQQGMGLGMHLVYNLITHRMRGSIQCESAPGQGVHFFIEVPL